MDVVRGRYECINDCFTYNKWIKCDSVWLPSARQRAPLLRCIQWLVTVSYDGITSNIIRNKKVYTFAESKDDLFFLGYAYFSSAFANAFKKTVREEVVDGVVDH